MKIVVCIKQVPDTTGGVVKVDPVTGTLRRDLMPTIINHDDKTGIEAALQLREKVGGTVTVVTMGPPQADVALREALAMGADEAVLVSGREFGGSDTYATSGILAGALQKIGYDIIITGRQAIDGDTAQVGPQLAEKLGVPQVSYVEEVIDAKPEAITVKRQFEDGYHIIRIKTPCLLTAIAELAEPRYMTVSGIVDAYASTGAYCFNVYGTRLAPAVLTIESGTYIGAPSAVQVGAYGTAYIKGGFFDCLPAGTVDEDRYRYTLNCLDKAYDDGTAKIIVTGGTFVNFNPADNQAEGQGTNFVADGYKVISEEKPDGDVWYTVVPK